VSIDALARIPEGNLRRSSASDVCQHHYFNALRHSGACLGDLVAIQGIGRLSHLGIPFASKFGFATVAIGRGSESRLGIETRLKQSEVVDKRLRLFNFR